MYIDFIHLFSFNCWIKINFDFKCTLSSKMFSCKFLRFLLVFMIAKNCHQHFNFLHIIIFVIHHLFKRKMVHPQFVFTFQPNCHNPSLGLATKARACKVAGQEKKPDSERKCEGMNPHTPKGASTLGVGVMVDS